MSDRANSGIRTGGAAALMQARERMAGSHGGARPAMATAPTREDLQAQLFDVQAKSAALFRQARDGGGLTARQHSERAELGRLELKLIADIRAEGRRPLGAPHRRR